jgi:hypothetical protein
MQKELNCLVVTEKDGGFNVFYTSISEGKNDTHSPRNIIHRVEYYGHDLLLSSLREKPIYKEIEAAVKNNAVNTWEEIWGKLDKRKELVATVKEELTGINTLTANTIREYIAKNGEGDGSVIDVLKGMIADRPNYMELTEETKQEILNF